MRWKTRTLAELLAAEPLARSDRGEAAVMVNTEEGRILAAAGAQVSSGSRNLERNTQYYQIGGKTFFWLAGYADGERNDDFPVSQDGTRLGEIVRVAKALG